MTTGEPFDEERAVTVPDSSTEPSTVTVDAAAARGNARLPESTRIGRYLIFRHVGAGATGDVYLAYDETLDRRVAIKLLRPNVNLGWSIRREAHALARLSHPNVVQIHDVGMHDGRPFISMEFVNGASLNRWLSAEPRRPEAILRMFVQCGRGLVAAHEAGLVHRDFKPSNVMVGDDGRARVLDFGVVSGPAFEVGPSGEKKGTVVGTPGYMSPEQLLAQSVGPASDQFSFAVAVFKAIYGQPPFDGADAAEMMHNVLQGAIRTPSAKSGPDWLAPMLRRALSRDPGARHPSMSALLADIERHLPRDDRLDAHPTRKGRRIFTALVLVTVAMIVVAFVVRGGLDMTTNRDLAFIPSVVLVLTACSLVVLRKRVFANRFGVQMIAVFVIVTATTLVYPLVALRFDQPVAQLIVFDMLAIGFECALVAVLFVRWFAGCAALMFAGAIVAMLFPELATIALPVARLGALLIAFMKFSKD